MKVSTFLMCLLAMWSYAGRGLAGPVVGALEIRSDLDDLARGLVLIGELNCTACHELGGGAKWIQSKSAPALQDLQSRVSFEWLKEYLENPHSIKPGATMPDVLTQLSTKEKADAAEAIARYLFSLQPGIERVEPVQPGSQENGKALYESIGCVACHSPEQAISGSVPLGQLASKYTLTGLVAFLKDPLAVRPGGRMPDFGLEHEEAVDIATYLLRDQDAGGNTDAPNPALVSKGRADFVSNGCVACHQIEDSNLNVARKRTEISDWSAGCLSGETGIWPYYSLSVDQINAIKFAMTGPAPDLSNEQQIQLAMLSFNCVACHERSGFGGVADDRDAWFGTEDPNIGEQGRIPPSLSDAGAKLQSTAIRKILVEGAPVRPYLKTRMPVFGETNLNHLIELLDKTDHLPAVEDVQVGSLDDFKNAGRKLAGNEALNCIACHAFKGTKSGNMAVVDLTEMSLRLRKEWFVQYLQDPQGFSPTTLMPGFWTGDKSGFTELFEGDAQPQVQAIWAYLGDGYGASEPRGLYREPMRIIARDEARMLRRSYPNVGKRGIGVGYPGQVNLVFNAEQMCLSAIWKGEFLDPAGVWTSQGHGTARPLARPIDLSNEPELTRRRSLNAAWPEADDRPEHLRFKGYTLDQARRPKFRYEFDQIEVTDYFVEIDPVGLERTIRFTSAMDLNAILVFRAATHESIEPLSTDSFRIGSDLTMEFPGNDSAVLVDREGKSELRVPVQLVDGYSELVVRYVW